jgi:hypothetical protein
MRYPLQIKQARIVAGAFAGCHKPWLASALDTTDGKHTASEMSLLNPGAIYGLFAKESAGWRNLGWWRNGEQV